MSKRSKTAPKFVVRKSTTDGEYMKVNGGVIWVGDKNSANSYPSKYAAKQHLQMLDNVPESRVIELA